MLKRELLINFDPLEEYTFDFGKSLQNDETVIITFRHDYNYTPEISLRPFHLGVQFLLDKFTLSGALNDNYLSFEVMRYSQVHLILPANMIDNTILQIFNLENSTFDAWLNIATVKGFIPPSLTVAAIGDIQPDGFYTLINMLSNSIAKLSVSAMFSFETATAGSVWHFVCDKSGNTYNAYSLIGATTSGIYKNENVRIVQPNQLRFDVNGLVLGVSVIAHYDFLI